MKPLSKKITLAAAAGIASVGIMSAFAMGPGMGFGKSLTPDELATRHAQMFEQHASLLGVSVADVKTAWAQGKNLFTLAKERGISETDLQAKMRTLRETEMKEHLQSLVSKGVITQAQADSRLAYMKSNSSVGKAFRGGHRGERMGMMGF